MTADEKEKMARLFLVDIVQEGVPHEHLLFCGAEWQENRRVCDGAWFPVAEIIIMPTE